MPEVGALGATYVLGAATPGTDAGPLPPEPGALLLTGGATGAVFAGAVGMAPVPVEPGQIVEVMVGSV